MIYETVKCPHCRHDCEFGHEEGQTLGVLYCKFCEEVSE